MKHIHVYNSFLDVPDEVRHCLSYPQQPNFLLSYEWFFLLFETSLRSYLIPRIYVVADEHENTIGAVFCGVQRRTALREIVSLSNFYTTEYSAALVPNGGVSAEAIFKSVIDRIVSERPRWHVINLKLLREDALQTGALAKIFGSSGFMALEYFQFDNWYLPSAGTTFEAYFSNRPSQLRHTINRKQKRLEKTDGFTVRVVGQTRERLSEGIEDFVRVYNKSWKHAEPFPRFIPTLATVCAELQILRLGVLYVDNTPVAGQLWINTHQKAIVYKLAYDQAYRDLGVGSILSKEMFRIALDEDRVAEIDYGIGSDAYKKDWMSSVRKLYGIRAFNRSTIRGLLLGIFEVSKTRLHKMLQRLRPFLTRRRFLRPSM